ncbi:MAG: hypothetical protein MHM6MM_003889 [Cercozoa sp. M6MM]
MPMQVIELLLGAVLAYVILKVAIKLFALFLALGYMIFVILLQLRHRFHVGRMPDVYMGPVRDANHWQVFQFLMSRRGVQARGLVPPMPLNLGLPRLLDGNPRECVSAMQFVLTTEAPLSVAVLYESIVAMTHMPLDAQPTLLNGPEAVRDKLATFALLVLPESVISSINFAYIDAARRPLFHKLVGEILSVRKTKMLEFHEHVLLPLCWMLDQVDGMQPRMETDRQSLFSIKVSALFHVIDLAYFAALELENANTRTPLSALIHPIGAMLRYAAQTMDIISEHATSVFDATAETFDLHADPKQSQTEEFRPTKCTMLSRK